MHRLKIFAVVLLASISFGANAAEDYLQPYFKTPAVKIGEGKYYYKGLIHAYDAALFSPSAKLDESGVFALKLTYKTEIDGEDIADKSIEEINKQSKLSDTKLAEWRGKMKAIIPNVVEGTSLTGVNLPGKGVVFFKDGKKLGEIADGEFAKRFFDIWLSSKTSSQSLRAKLLGDKGD